MEYLTHSLIDKSEALQIVKKLRAEKSSWQDGKKPQEVMLRKSNPIFN